MDFSIVKLFPDNLVKALCETLIHSLWQGVILAALTAAIIAFTRKSSPARRYNFLIAALALFAVATVFTFVIAINKTAPTVSAPAAYHKGMVINVQLAQQGAHAIAPQKSFTDTIISYFNKNSATIVLIWFLIVCARCVQLAAGLQGVFYLRNKNIFRADKAWENRVQQLAKNLGIRRMVNIAESGLAKVPMVVGHLKPLILIPVGLLTALSTDEIEAILIHELAHIQRADYLVNLLQSLVEIIFFFNPAVLWISALIKTERENCCDDIAVAQSSSKVTYIKALVSCQEYDATSPAYAMALRGTKNHLKNRVTRIISNNNQSLNRVEKSLLAIGLVTAGLCTAAFTNAEKINKLVSTTAKAVTHMGDAIKKQVLPAGQANRSNAANPAAKLTNPDTAKSKLKIFSPAEIGDNTSFQIANNSFITKIYKEAGTLYQLNYRHNELVSMQVNGKTIPADKILSYQSVIDRIPHASRNESANASNNNYREITDEADRKKEERDALNLGNNNAMANLNGFQTALDSMKIKFRSDDSRIHGILSSHASKQEKLNQLKSLAIADSVNGGYKKAQGYDGKLTKYTTPYAPKSPYDSHAKPIAPVAPKQPVDYKSYGSTKGDEPGAKMINDMLLIGKLKDDERRDRMINDLLHDGIISTKDNLSFKISNSEFIINGKKQPDNIHQKYSEKYVKQYSKGQGEWSWLYNYDTAAKSESNTVVDNKKN